MGVAATFRHQVLTIVWVAFFIQAATIRPVSAQADKLSNDGHSATNLPCANLIELRSWADHEGIFPWTGALRDRAGVVQIQPIYFGEVFTNTRGGISTNDSTQYLGLLDLGFEWDFDENNSFLPGKFFLLAQNTHGRGITTDFVGDSQFVSNIDSFKNIMQVSEYWWEFEMLDSCVTVRLGKQDINTEFLFIDKAADFIQSTFGLSPSTAYPTYPDPSMAAVVLDATQRTLAAKNGAVGCLCRWWRLGLFWQRFGGCHWRTGTYLCVG